MKKLSKACGKIDVLLKVLFWLIIVAVVMEVMSLGALALLPTSVEEMNGWSLKLGNISLSLAASVDANVDLLRVEAWATMANLIVAAAVVCYGITILRNILSCMIYEKPFDSSVSMNIKKMGELIVISSVLINGVIALGDIALYKFGNLTEVLNSEAIANVGIDVKLIDAKMLFLGTLVILLSYVFKYGHELQQQADETL